LTDEAAFAAESPGTLIAERAPAASDAGFAVTGASRRLFVVAALPIVFATAFAAAFAKIAFDTLSLFDGRSLRARSQRQSPTAKEPSII
jgi:hypothetical protein